MTASGLRKEAARGRLVIERIAGKDYTTLAAIADMRKLCRLPSKRTTGLTPADRSEEAHARVMALLSRLENVRSPKRTNPNES